MGEPLTDEQIAQEERFLQGIPRINIGALFLPPIWGPAHGFWVTILFYPAWVFADNCFYSAYTMRTVPTIVLAVIVFLILLAVTVAFSLIGQPMAAHRAAERGKTKEEYLSAQRKWAIGCVIGGLVMIALATYYNIAIRGTL
ncbi:MAG: viscotoxin-A3 [Eggerthellaceae bacterium]|nr:viscotoxin-A3 [Eggerthellaceae bacterium]